MEKSNKIFNKKIGEIMELLEVSNNIRLKEAVKSKIWQLKKELELKDCLTKMECENHEKNYNK